MKIKILKRDGVVGVSTRDPNQFKRCEGHSTLDAISYANDLFLPNVFHFYDFDGYVFELNRNEFVDGRDSRFAEVDGGLTKKKKTDSM